MSAFAALTPTLLPATHTNAVMLGAMPERIVRSSSTVPKSVVRVIVQVAVAAAGAVPVSRPDELSESQPGRPAPLNTGVPSPLEASCCE